MVIQLTEMPGHYDPCNMSIKNTLCAKFIWLSHMGACITRSKTFDKDLVKQAL